MHIQGLTGKDMNKYSKPKVAELGGVLVFLGFSFGLFLAIFAIKYLKLMNIELSVLLAGFCTVSMIAFIGVIDDIIGWKKGIRQWQHALFPIVAALPLMAIKISNGPISLPLIGLLPHEFILPFGVISFSLLYSLILIPIGVTGASNATNMLAGLNGLETGLGILIIGTLAIIAALNGKIGALVFAIPILGALVAFLFFNKFPAKIFGGDGLTLMTGASIAVICIIGDMEKIGVLLIALFFIELILKAKTKFQGESFGIPQKNGLLFAPKEKHSLTHYFMAIFPAREDRVVARMLLTQAVICLIVILVVLLNQMEVLFL
ncbi:MAG: hypothetical protein NTY48_01285 [Candidatus Diapherotrites archaeon]|nr:hypothetical protein [Candidatus Diapherotrites archaeon]